MLTLVFWSFVLPAAAALLHLTAKLIAMGVHAIVHTPIEAPSEDRSTEIVIRCHRAATGRLRAKSHVH